MYQGKRTINPERSEQPAEGAEKNTAKEPRTPAQKAHKAKVVIGSTVAVVFIAAFLLAAGAIFRFIKQLSGYDPSINKEEAEVQKSSESSWQDSENQYFLDTVPYDPEKFSRDEKGRIHYEDENYRSENGIDVSLWQGNVDWNAVKADGIDFVLIRVGYMNYESGEVNFDFRYHEYLEGVQAAGIPFGLYFYSNAVTTEEALFEAESLVKLLGDAKPTLPIFYDWERTDREGDRTYEADAFMISAICRVFCDTVEEAGYESGVYLNSYLLQNDVRDDLLTNYRIWMAEYDDAPTCTGQYEFWQYTNEGKVDGIQEQVDLDLRFVKK